jgi:hypothetical protein
VRPSMAGHQREIGRGRNQAIVNAAIADVLVARCSGAMSIERVDAVVGHRASTAATDAVGLMLRVLRRPPRERGARRSVARTALRDRTASSASLHHGQSRQAGAGRLNAAHRPPWPTSALGTGVSRARPAVRRAVPRLRVRVAQRPSGPGPRRRPSGTAAGEPGIGSLSASNRQFAASSSSRRLRAGRRGQCASSEVLA